MMMLNVIVDQYAPPPTINTIKSNLIIMVPASYSFNYMNCNHTDILSEYTKIHMPLLKRGLKLEYSGFNLPSFKSAQSDAMLCVLCNTDIVWFEMIITKLAPEVKQQWAGTNIKLWKAQLDAAVT